MQKVNWNQAFEIVKQFNQQGGYAGHNDWRLPAIVELKTLFAGLKANPATLLIPMFFLKMHNGFGRPRPVLIIVATAWIVNF